jgi:hypothetical protein
VRIHVTSVLVPSLAVFSFAAFQSSTQAQVFIPDEWMPTRFDATATQAQRVQASALIWHQGIQQWHDYARLVSCALGDISYDGIVDTNDVAKIRANLGETCSDKEGPRYELLLRGDVNMDMEINTDDMEEALQRGGTLTYTNGFEFLLGMLADPPKIPGTDIPVWPGRDLHSQAMSDSWTRNEHTMTDSALWPRNHSFAISSDWMPDGHSLLDSYTFRNPWRGLPVSSHSKDQTSLWPPNHILTSSVTWRQVPSHDGTVSENRVREIDHTRSTSSTWPSNHLRDVSVTWPRHTDTTSQLWPPGHIATSSSGGQPSPHNESISNSWFPGHVQETSHQNWPNNHLYEPSAGWGTHAQATSQAIWPPGHYSIVSQSWNNQPRPGWPANHSFDMSSTWGQPDTSHDLITTARNIKDALPGGGTP